MHKPQWQRGMQYLREVQPRGRDGLRRSLRVADALAAQVASAAELPDLAAGDGIALSGPLVFVPLTAHLWIVKR